MITIGTILKVADNTGAKTVKCIKLLCPTQAASVGDCILVSVRSVRSSFSSTGKTVTGSSGDLKRNLKKGQIFKALIIRTKKPIFKSIRKYGLALSFTENAVVLISSQTETNNMAQLIGSRIFGPITRDLREKKFLGIISKAKRML